MHSKTSIPRCLAARQVGALDHRFEPATPASPPTTKASPSSARRSLPPLWMVETAFAAQRDRSDLKRALDDARPVTRHGRSAPIAGS